MKYREWGMEKNKQAITENKSERLKELEKMIEESGFKFGQKGTFKPVFGPAQGDNGNFTFYCSDTTCLKKQNLIPANPLELNCCRLCNN